MKKAPSVAAGAYERLRRETQHTTSSTAQPNSVSSARMSADMHVPVNPSGAWLRKAMMLTPSPFHGRFMNASCIGQPSTAAPRGGHFAIQGCQPRNSMNLSRHLGLLLYQ